MLGKSRLSFLSVLSILFMTVGLIAVSGHRAFAVWPSEIVDSSGDVGDDVSTVVDSAGFTHSSYYDKTNMDLKYAYFDGTAWQTETVDSNGNVGRHTSIGVDSLNRPHISYFDITGTALKYAYHNGTQWQIAVVDDDLGSFIGADPSSTSIDVDSSDRPHIAYITAPYGCCITYAYHDGVAWQIEYPALQYGVDGYYPSLALDSSDRPHISYTSWDFYLRHAYHDGIQWYNNDYVDSSGNVGEHTSLDVDFLDRPHISYYDSATDELKYAYHDGAAWQIEAVATQSMQYSSIAVDALNRPHIAHWDMSNFNLQHLYNDGTSWTSNVVDDTPIYFYGPDFSLALDPANVPRISYYDSGNGTLKYAEREPICSEYTVKADCNNDPLCEWIGNPKKGSCQDVPVTCPDNDGDGYGFPGGDVTCPDGTAEDCDDSDPAVNPGAAEIPYNGVDDDCNPATTDNPPLITTETLPDGTANQVYDQYIQATNGVQPYTFSIISGSLPPGLNLATNGRVIGAPTATGTFAFTVQVEDAELNTATKALQIVVTADPLVITTTTLPDGVVDQAYDTFILAAGGVQPYTFSVISGSTPPGLNFAPNGRIIGAPTATGTFAFTVRVEDAELNTATKALQIVITADSLVITTASLPDGMADQAYDTFILAAGGVQPYTFSVISGSTPPGLNFAPNGRIIGAPTATGTFAFTVQVEDAELSTATKDLQIFVMANALTITTEILPDCVADQPYDTYVLAAGGVQPYTFSVISGSTPPGLNFAANGRIIGVPTATGTFAFTVQVEDEELSTATKALQIVCTADPLVITTAALPDATTDLLYDNDILATGGVKPYSWSIASGSLPPGLTLISNGRLFGVPTATGTYDFTVQVTDAESNVITKGFQIVVTADPLVITTAAMPGGLADQLYDNDILATGGVKPYSWSIASGSLPPGLTLISNGRLFGVPTATGTYDFTVQVTDAELNVTTKALQIVVTADPLVITTTALPDATTDLLYDNDILATGGVKPYSWSIASGILPPGLTLISNGRVFGISTTIGTYDFTLQVVDAESNVATKALAITTTGTKDCVDSDSDGYGVGTECAIQDCDDTDPSAYPGGDDSQCDGIDNDCNGTADDAYVPTQTNCGTGECAATGQLECQGGTLGDTCTPGAPQTEGPADDPTCSDGLDNDCDTLVDEPDPDCQPVCSDYTKKSTCQAAGCTWKKGSCS